MEKLAICKECKQAFSFRPLGSFAASTTDNRAFCTDCGNEALVADGDFTEFFKVYHTALPYSVGRKERKEILALARKLSRKPDHSAAVIKKERLSPSTKKLFDVLGKLVVGGAVIGGGYGGAVGGALMLADREANRRDHAEIMTALHDLVAAYHQPADSRSTRSARRSTSRGHQARSRTPAPEQSASAPTEKPRTNPPQKRKKRDPSVPLSKSKPK